MIDKIKQVLANKSLRKKLIYTFIALFIFRFLSHIPVPGVSIEQLRQFFNQNQIFGLLNLFTGGAMRNFSIVMLGVGPYITSSIIFQLLGIIVPQLEELNKEGEAGRQKINYYTRILTVPLALIQGYAMISLLRNQGIVIDFSTFQLVATLIALTAGTMLLMWIGELISENGIGNGISLIITLGIIANVPLGIVQTITVGDASQIIGFLIIAALTIMVIASIVYFTEAERRVPVTYARRVRGNRTYGGVDTYLPIKVNIGGVIPIIFALSFMIFPGVLAKFFEQARSEQIANIARWITNMLQNQLVYGIAYFALVVIFSFFYATIVFQPKQVAENLQKQGGFVPGLRPGKETSHHLENIVSKITLVGGSFLAIVAVLPFIVQSITGITTIALGGTGILIIVSVIIETARQINSQLIMHSYDNY